ncbi:MAG: metal ABC transporter permease [Leptospiraceae bacterium]|nr:metal ABC transporter permease [Leptospiraceae bacterium]
MNAILESLLFYEWQIAQAALLAALMAAAGIWLAMRRQVTFSLVASQAAVSASIISQGVFQSAMWGQHFLAWPIGLLLAWPFYRYSLRSRNSEVVLLGGMLVYAGLSELIAAALHVRMHFVQAWFGDVLTTAPDDIIPSVLLGTAAAAVLFFSYPALLLQSTDSEYARVAGLPVEWLNTLFFLLLGPLLIWSIQMTGMFVSMTHLIVPALAAIPLARSVPRAMLLAALISIGATTLAFGFSFLEINNGPETLHLPTSSLILVLTGAISFGLYYWHHRHHLRHKARDRRTASLTDKD